jgi:hypothetical protein
MAAIRSLSAKHLQSGAVAEPSTQTLLERAGARAAGIGSIGAGHPRRRAFLQWGLSALIFAFLVGFVLRQWSDLPDFSWRFAPGWLVLSVVGVAGFYLIEVELWRFIVRSLGGHMEPAPARAIWGKSLLARYVPTNVLMVLARIVMAERLGVPKRVTFASVVYELGIVLATAVMVGSYFVIDLPALQGQPARFAVLLAIPLALVALHPRVFGPVCELVLRKTGREPLERTLGFGRVLALAALYLLTWASIGLAVFAFAAALHPIDIADLPYIAAAYPVAFCVAVLTFIVPSGLGTRDAALATAIAAVLPAAVATAIAVAFRLVQTAVELGFVGVMVGLARRRGARSVLGPDRTCGHGD